MLAVHLDGYLNVLAAALPIMAAAGHGRILGVTSGSGWRAADAGAYGCAKRAVASLTWQLGRHAPAGRRRQRHVTDRRDPDGHRGARPRPAEPGGSGRRPPAGCRSARCPRPSELGPLGAHLVGDDFAWCRGRVLFAGGSEVAVIDEPRLLEVVRTDDVASLAHAARGRRPPARWPRPRPTRRAAAAATPGSVASSTSRPPATSRPPPVRSCAVVADRPEVAAALSRPRSRRGA